MISILTKPTTILKGVILYIEQGQVKMELILTERKIDPSLYDGGFVVFISEAL